MCVRMGIGCCRVRRHRCGVILKKCRPDFAIYTYILTQNSKLSSPIVLKAPTGTLSRHTRFEVRVSRSVIARQPRCYGARIFSNKQAAACIATAFHPPCRAFNTSFPGPSSPPLHSVVPSCAATPFQPPSGTTSLLRTRPFAMAATPVQRRSKCDVPALNDWLRGVPVRRGP